MAKRYSKKRYQKRYRRSFKKRNRGYKKNSIKQLAYKMGLIQRGLKNPDSMISESYNRGLAKPEAKAKRTLF